MGLGESWRAVSARATSMAVWGVGSELLSAGRSLVRRERTGNQGETGHRGGRHPGHSGVDPESWTGIPCVLDQGTLPSEQGIHRAEQRPEAPCSDKRHATDDYRIDRRGLREHQRRRSDHASRVPRTRRLSHTAIRGSSNFSRQQSHRGGGKAKQATLSGPPILRF
jgi:hypothetical protein